MATAFRKKKKKKTRLEHSSVVEAHLPFAREEESRDAETAEFAEIYY
jgi:hypothetical protein